GGTPQRPAAVRRAGDRERADRDDPDPDPPALRPARQFRAERRDRAGEGSGACLSARLTGSAATMSFARLFASLYVLMLASMGMAVGQEAAPGFHPNRTAWGDPDFRGIWPVQNINDARIPLERPAAMGERAWLTEEEFAERLKRA